MEDADGRLAAEFVPDGAADGIDVPHHVRIIVVVGIARRVFPVAAHVEYDDIEITEKPLPKLEIAVDREAVSVAQDQPRRRIHAALATHSESRMVRALYLDFNSRRENIKAHSVGVNRRGRDS